LENFENFEIYEGFKAEVHQIKESIGKDFPGCQIQDIDFELNGGSKRREYSEIS